MARDNDISIHLKAIDSATKVLENAATNSLPAFAKRVAALGASFVSINAGVDVLRDSIRAALESEKATAALTAALKSQGLSVSQNLPHLTQYAGSLSRVTAADDEAIQGAQKLLISIGGLTGNGLDRATKAALDLSAGLGIDLNDAAEKIAKAANGSTKAFTQLGVKFRDGASDGDKFVTVLDFINERFGGAAQAQVETMVGKVEQLAKAWGEVEEATGKLAVSAGGGGALTLLAGILNVIANDIDQGKTTQVIAMFNAFANFGNDTPAAFNALLALFDKVDSLKIDDSVTAALAGKSGIFANDPGGLKIAVDAIDKIIAETDAAAAAAKKAAAEYAAWLRTFDARATVLPLPKPTGDQPFSGMTVDQGALSEQLDATQLQSWIDQLDTVPDVLLSLSDGFLKLGDEIDNSTAKVATFGEVAMTTLGDATATAAAQLGGAMVDAAFGAEVAWNEALRSIISGLVKAVVQAVILKAITTAIGGGGGAALSGGGVVGGSTAHAASGGWLVPSYAAGGMFASRGTDIVPAMLTPGEAVLPRGITHEILGGRASVVPAGSGGASAIVPIHIGGAHLTTLFIRNAGSFIEVQEYLDARRG